MFTKEEQDKILEKIKSMTDKDWEELNKSIVEASKGIELSVKQPVCECCYCRANRLIG